MLRELWNSKPVVWIRTFAEVYGIVQLVGVLGGSTLLAGGAWALAEALLNLTLVPKILIGTGVFLLALTTILAGLDRVQKKRASKTSTRIYIKTPMPSFRPKRQQRIVAFHSRRRMPSLPRTSSTES